jgi:hypothetical protein
MELCGCPTKDGHGPCGKPAGWGTPHSTGPCKHHGGLFPTVQKHHARLEALNFARGQLGQELDIDPLEGVLVAVRLSYGTVDYWRHRIAANPERQDDLQEQYQRALMDYTRICDIAIKAGVSERQIKILERAAEQLSLLFEELVAAAQATVEQRERMMEAWVKGIARLEAPAVDSTAEDLAA